MSEAPAEQPSTRPDRWDGRGPKRARFRRTALSMGVAILSAVLLGCCLFYFFWPGSGRAWEPVNRSYCAGNLRQIVISCLVYAEENGGRFPDSVATLYENADLTVKYFNCPASDATEAVGPTTRATANLLQKSPPPGRRGHCQSYVYVGRGVTGESPPTVVVAYDLPTNHRNQGGNVVYADAHVEWHTAAGLAAIDAAVQAGQNPPP